MLRPRREPRPFTAVLMAATVAATATVRLSAAHIRGKIVRVGYPGSGRNAAEQGMDLYRPGFWTPLLVELNNDDGDLFEGQLQARQSDRDGDQIIATLPVAIRGTKNVFIYVPAGPPQAQQPFTLRVTGTEGGPVQIFDDANNACTEWKPFPDPRPLAPADQLLLDISRQPLNQLATVANDPTLVRPLVVGRCTPANLPDSEPGLQMVDIVVWDDADPTQFRDISQQQALLDWVRRGGTLVLGISRNWELLNKSAFGPLLPAPLKGTVTTQQMDAISETLRGIPAEFDNLVTHVPIRRTELAPDAISILPNLPKESEDPDNLIYVAARPYGRGRIVLCTAEIQDWLHQGGSTQNYPLLLRAIFGLRKEIAPEEDAQVMTIHRDPFQVIENMTGFRVTSGFYFIAAFLFVVVYILIATFGSWNVLRQRGRVQYAWTAFALVAAIASATSLAAVQVIRGIGNRVEQLCVVDAAAGSKNAVANCYFGLKTASHVLLDLAVPRDIHLPADTADNAGGLLPLPAAGDDLSVSQYSAQARYQAGGSVGQLWNVPLRATLKQFQGYWAGGMSGQLDAKLTRRAKETFHLTLDSWIENNLDTDLTECYLLLTNRNIAGEYVEGKRNPSRGLNVQVYPLGTLKRGKRLVWKDFLIDHERAEQKRLKDAGQTVEPVDENNPEWKNVMELPLDGHQRRWLKEGYNVRPNQGFGAEESEQKLEGKSSYYAALLVMSTFAELSFDKGALGISQEMQRARGFDLDRSEALTTRTSLLFGFAESHGGPCRLAVRPAGGTPAQWETVEPSAANTMYRFVIPLGSK